MLRILLLVSGLLGDGWHLPPLIPGRETVVHLEAAEAEPQTDKVRREFRFHAGWNLSVRVEAKSGDGREVHLKLRSPTQSQEASGLGSCVLEQSLSAGEQLLVQLDAPWGETPIRVTVEETPDREAWRATLDLLTRVEPDEEGLALLDLAREAIVEAEIARDENDREACLEAIERTLDILSESSSLADNALAAQIHDNASFYAYQCGDLQTMQRAALLSLRYWERARAPDDPALLIRRSNYVSTLALLEGRQQEALEHQERLLPWFERAYAPEDPLLWKMRHNLADFMRSLGQLLPALELNEQLIAAHVDREDPELLLPQAYLLRAQILITLDDVDRAETFLEPALALRDTPPEGADARVVAGIIDRALARMALIRTARGDLLGARALYEEIVAYRTRTETPENPNRIAAEANLADILKQLGDWAGARTIEERALTTLNAHSPSHHDLDVMRINLAESLQLAGEMEEAVGLLQQALENRTARYSTDNFLVQNVRLALATVLRKVGDRNRARGLLEQVLRAADEGQALRPLTEARVLQLSAALAFEAGDREEGARLCRKLLERLDGPEGHEVAVRDLGRGLTSALRAHDELESALKIAQRILELREATLRLGHPRRVDAQIDLALTLSQADEKDRLGEALEALLTELTTLVERPGLSHREMSEQIYAAEQGVSVLLSLLDRAPAAEGLLTRTFELVETLRAYSAAGSLGVRGPPSDEVAHLRTVALDARRKLNDLAARFHQPQSGPAPSPADLMAGRLARDRADAKLRSALLEHGWQPPSVDTEMLAKKLPPHGALVCYRRYRHYGQAKTAPDQAGSRDQLLAFVLSPDGKLTRFDLGPYEELLGEVRHWRNAVGRGTGLQRTPDILPPSAPSAAGGELRKSTQALWMQVVEPVLGKADLKTAFVCLDDALHLIPLDALAREDGTLLGDDVRIHVLNSVGDLLGDSKPPQSEGRLLALGNIDYGAVPGQAPSNAKAPIEASARPANRATSSFRPLPGTEGEIAAVRRLFQESRGREAHVLEGEAATSAELQRLAPTVRFLHIATHGFFAEGLPEDDRHEQPRFGWEAGVTERLTRLAPWTLCGLALAGANEPAPPGQPAGILTAEQLAGMDLTGCDLAVLSACESNVGHMRAGQGVRSLQSALHAAGARATLTSIWKVDDEWTVLLMEEFYRNLWQQKEPVDQALWQAKRTLIDRGARPRDWAGWVLTGALDH